jgi:hypothetical protein
MAVPIFTGKIDKGKLVHDTPQRYLVYMTSLEGQKIELTLRKFRKKRSDQQNRYYWGVVIDILGKTFGYEPEEMHEALKFKFLQIDSSIQPGLISARSTTKLSTTEFMDYISAIQRWAAQEFHIYLPDPNEAGF